VDPALQESLHQAARAVDRADAILIGAGAGMGVDSGLPDFRGDEGFWKAYPPFAELGLRFTNLANPRWFERDASLAWGFYGHRLSLYRSTIPHAGFETLLRWSKNTVGGAFVLTSNVDGQFQRAGFDRDRIFECHGSIHHLQSVAHSATGIWSADGVEVEVDEKTFRALEPLPQCRSGIGLARPNILMFGDWGWLPDRSDAQEQRMSDFLSCDQEISHVVIEIGAGSAVPTVRHACESLSARLSCPLVRINPRESHGPSNSIGIAMGASEALSRMDDLLQHL
jgi:NAD-dependent SIR2 family protein deacetylase